jgi:hypothetical protein
MAVRGTMLLATVAWALAELSRTDHIRGRQWWTIGAGLAVIHVLLAFHAVYAWSHEAAVVDTARQTAALTGWSWGGGVSVNYVFIAIWIADAAWWWIEPASHEARPQTIERARFALFVFMFANGAIVFASGIGRIVGVVCVGAVVVSALRKKPQEEVV